MKELTALVKEVNPDARKKGTFLDFAIVSLNTERNNPAGCHYMIRDLGSTCTGQKGKDDEKSLANSQ